MRNDCYIMTFREAIETAERLLREGFDIEIRRIGADRALVFALKKNKIRRPD